MCDNMFLHAPPIPPPNFLQVWFLAKKTLTLLNKKVTLITWLWEVPLKTNYY